MTNLENEFERELYDEIAKLPLVELDSNSVVLVENSYVRNIPILIEGSIKVRKTDESGKEIILYHINPGESCILSITSCLNNKQCNAEAYVEKQAKIIMVPAEKVILWMEKYSSWKRYVFSHYYNRFDELLSLIDAIAFKQVDQRLLKKLKEYQRNEGNVITITHMTLAKEIGTAREVISRLLKHLAKEKVIKLERGIIKIIGRL